MTLMRFFFIDNIGRLAKVIRIFNKNALWQVEIIALKNHVKETAKAHSSRISNCVDSAV